MGNRGPRDSAIVHFRGCARRMNPAVAITPGMMGKATQRSLMNPIVSVVLLCGAFGERFDLRK